jgi:hypothetical protein
VKRNERRILQRLSSGVAGTEILRREPGWKRICDIPDSDSLYLTWDELPKKSRNSWIREYGEYSAEYAWRQFGRSFAKFHSDTYRGRAIFYPNYEMVNAPNGHNVMMVFKVLSSDEYQVIITIGGELYAVCSAN